MEEGALLQTDDEPLSIIPIPGLSLVMQPTLSLSESTGYHPNMQNVAGSIVARLSLSKTVITLNEFYLRHV